jgi:signal transduction histidine kinase
LDKQIKSIILACEPQWLEKNLDMELYLEEVEYSGDEDMLSQVWINLIHNSIKFTPARGEVKIELHEKEEGIEFTIADSGIGIGEEDVVHIFERFYKADKSRDRGASGSGLGLSITKKIVEIHNGTIKVESSIQRGTKFTVVFPRA